MEQTINMPNDLAAALEAYRRDQEIPLDLSEVVQTALREYLAERGYVAGMRTLRITPASRGSGHHDISVEHDRYLAE